MYLHSLFVVLLSLAFSSVVHGAAVIEATLVSSESFRTVYNLNTPEAEEVGTFRIVFNLKAVGDNAYIDKTLTRRSNLPGAGTFVAQTTGSSITFDSNSIDLAMSIDRIGTPQIGDTQFQFFIPVGETAQFIFDATVSPHTTGWLGLKLNRVNYSTIPSSAAGFFQNIDGIMTQDVRFIGAVVPEPTVGLSFLSGAVMLLVRRKR